MLAIRLLLIFSVSIAAVTLQAKATFPPPNSWVKDRVSEAKERLQKDIGGKMIWKSIEAHGGLEKWYQNGVLEFRWAYVPIKGPTRDSFQYIDTWNSRARHHLSSEPSVEFGWDGKQAWANRKLPEGYNARFWSLTPYYFLAMPFVFSDKGVNFKAEGSMSFEGKEFSLVRITFGKDIGDSPDDYYVALINKKNNLLEGVRYIVSYKGFFKGGKTSPEKLMMFDNQKKVDGIVIPTGARSFSWEKDKAGKQSVTSKISKIKFDKSIKNEVFEKPKDSMIQNSL